jgi:transcriptional regulator with XRE-family HTH domain
MLAAQCQLARAILKLSVEDLAERADVAAETVLAFEAGEAPDDGATLKIEVALEDAGIEFTFGDRPGLRLKTLDGIIEVSAGPPVKPAGH